MFILVIMVGVRLPSQFPEVFERDAVRVNRYLSPRIVRKCVGGCAGDHRGQRLR